MFLVAATDITAVSSTNAATSLALHLIFNPTLFVRPPAAPRPQGSPLPRRNCILSTRI